MCTYVCKYVRTYLHTFTTKNYAVVKKENFNMSSISNPFKQSRHEKDYFMRNLKRPNVA